MPELPEVEALATFWDNPEVQRLLAERARQEAKDKKKKRKGKEKGEPRIP